MKALVTGSAGFIGSFVARRLLDRGDEVVGVDNLTDYYDVRLKHGRLAVAGVDAADLRPGTPSQSSSLPGYRFVLQDLADRERVERLFAEERFDRVCHLAAQAGVRYSIQKPEVYVESNLVGFANVLEGCRRTGVAGLTYASSSSVYGLNESMPFSARDNVDHPISFYAATKKCNELMAHSYSHLFNLPTTGLRFFTVYGPWGRPDMACFLFADRILGGKPIDVFNNGDMSRDFTYVDDIVEGVVRVIDTPAAPDPAWSAADPDPSRSCAPYRIYNIGRGSPGEAPGLHRHPRGVPREEGAEEPPPDAARRRSRHLGRHSGPGARPRIQAQGRRARGPQAFCRLVPRSPADERRSRLTPRAARRLDKERPVAEHPSMSRPSLLKRAAGVEGGEDRRILLALLLFTLLFRVLSLMMIHTGVDERDYWFSARRIVAGLPYDDIQHRTIRFAVILPVAAAQALLGTHPDVYYVVPLVLALAQVALIYRLGLRLYGRAAGFAAALMLVLFPYMIRGGSQVRPDTFALAYLLASLSFFLPYLRGDEHRLRNLLLAAVMLFAAYQAKITSLYFVPACLAAILWLRRSPRDAVVFCLPLLGLYAVEHACLYLLFGEPLGQLGIIMKNHLRGDYIEAMSFWGLFGRYSPQKLPWYWMAVMAAAAAASVWVFRARRGDSCSKALVLLAASFLFFETFAVAGLRPLRPVEPFLHRYLLPLLAPLLLLDAALLAAAWRKAAGEAGLGRLTARAATALLALILLSASLLFALPGLPAGLAMYANNPLRPRDHVLARVERYRAIVGEAYERGVPVVAEDRTAGRNALETCREFFLSDDALRHEGLPALRQASLGGAAVLVLLRPGAVVADALASADAPVVAARRNPLRVVQTRASAAPDLIRNRAGGEEQ